MKRITIVLLVFLCGNPLLAGDKDPSTKKAISIEDYFLIKDLGNPKISPDGKWIAYQLSTTNLEQDNRKSQIWMVYESGGEAIPLTAEKESSWSPTWSKDGKWLYFLSKRSTKQTQLWKLNMVHGGEAIQVTQMKKRGISSYKFSSDEKKLLLVLHDRDPDELKAEQDSAYVKPKKQISICYRSLAF